MPSVIRGLLLLVFILGGCTHVERRSATGAPPAPVILISIDGFRADYLDRGLSPTLAALATDGVRADALKPAFPTLTFPNHYTLVTGLYPDHHGIVDNRMIDPVSGKQFVYKDSESIADPAWWGLADDGWVITTHADAAKRTKFALGEHGYDNDDAAMRASFVAHGPAFRPGLRVAEFDSVDVYPLLAHLLAIKPQPNDGDYAAISGMLRDQQ